MQSLVRLLARPGHCRHLSALRVAPSPPLPRARPALLAAALIFLWLSPLLHAWPGHEFEEWQRITTWTRPDIHTDQAGQTDLAPLLMNKCGNPIDEIHGWEAKRSQYARCIMQILGTPGDLKIPDSQAEIIREEVLDDHVRRLIRIRSEADDWIPAWLLLPRKLGVGSATQQTRIQRPVENRSHTAGSRSQTCGVPAMICIHQTVAQGKQEPTGMQGDPQLAFALELVRRGFVCIAPDMIGFGQRIPPDTQPYHDSIAFYRKHPGWSYMGKMVWDVSRVVDYLRTLPFVDPLQIGSIGHSHGAYTTLFAAAFEPRISLAIASCGFTTLRSDPEPDRWSHRTALMPQIGTYLPDVGQIPFDWQHVCAMVAPRPLFVWYATQDDIFPNTDNLDGLFHDVRDVYRLYGAVGELSWHAFEGAHTFPVHGRQTAYRWLEERLFPTGDLDRTPRSTAEWEAQKELLSRVIRRTIGAAAPAAPALDMTTLETLWEPAYERRLIEYTVAPGERVRAYLCIPHHREGRVPGILVLHQTAAEGKREPVGLGGDSLLAFASDLAARGCITLAPDSITAGDRIDLSRPFDTWLHYQRHPDLSAMGKMLHDAVRAVDLLAKLEQVDIDRLGVIGHSLGAETALMLAAFDERIAATVASCGYATFAAEHNRTRWARDQWFSYMPKLRPVFLRGDLPAWDWPDVVRMIAPRALFQHTTREDDIFTESISAYEAGQPARAIWDLYDASDRFANVLKPGKHTVAAETKVEIYNWLNRQLRR